MSKGVNYHLGFIEQSPNKPMGLRTVNKRIALWVTEKVGTMWCAYAFAILALVSLPDAIKTGNPVVIVAWIAQTFLQLVLLPVIIVGQNIQAKPGMHMMKKCKSRNCIFSF